MAFDISPRDREAILSIWPTAGPFLRGSLKSFETAFSSRPNMMFSGADVALIAQMTWEKIEEAFGPVKETTKNEP